MNQVRHVGDGLESNLGAVECAPARRCSGSKKFVASLLSLPVWLRLIRGAGGLIQDTLYLRAQCTHRTPRRTKSVRNALSNDVEAVIGLRDDIRVLIDVIENLVQYGDQDIQPSLVAPHRIPMVMVTIEDGKAESNQRSLGIALRNFP
jgi:hypothetical protein